METGKAGDFVSKIETVKNRIGKENQFFDYGLHILQTLLTTNVQRSAYSTLEYYG